MARDHAFEAMSVEDCADAAGLPECALRLQQSLVPTVKVSAYAHVSDMQMVHTNTHSHR